MSIFKAYDIRGIVPDQLGADLARKIGQVFATFLYEEVASQREHKPDHVRIGVGRDARPSGDDLVPALIEGLTAGGATVLDFGRITTPMLYFGVGHGKLDGGVVATASHNPAQYNGFKFCRAGAFPISYDTGVGEFERRIAAGELQAADTPGKVEQHALFDDYAGWALGFAQEGDGDRLKVAIDTANGMAGLYASLFERLNIEVVPLYFDIDCTFPNHEANPLKFETLRDLRAAVREHGCAFGVGFDGDADRCVCVDNRGEVVRPDIMTALLAGEMLERRPGAAVMYDLRSSRIVPETIERQGGKPVRVRVGHSFAKAVMREQHAVFGGELSGHYYFEGAFQADSGLIALIEVLNVLRKKGEPLADLIEPLMAYHSTGELNFHVADKDAALAEIEKTFGPEGEGGKVDRLDGVTVTFDDWWFNTRPSNTEPLLRLVMECERKEDVEGHLADLKKILGTPE